MKFALIILIVSSSVFAQGGIRQGLCQWSGEVIENIVSPFTGRSCEEGSFEEYRDMSCGLSTTNNARIYHEGVNANLTGESADAYFHSLSDQVILQGVANNIYDMNKCQKEFFELYFADQERRNELKARARMNYEAIFPRLRRIQADMDEVRDRNIRRGLAVNASDGAMQRALERTANQNEESQSQFDELVNSIPLGNRPLMRNYILGAIRSGKSVNEFMNGFDAVVRRLLGEAQTSYGNIAAKKTSIGRSRNAAIFNIDPTMREQFMSAGLIEQYVIENEMYEHLDSGYLCRIRREKQGCIAVTTAEVVGSILLPYAGAAMAFRSGLVAVRTVQSARAARAMGQLHKATLFGRNSAEVTLMTDDLIRSCTADEYLTSKGHRSCNAEKQFYETIVESDMASCILNSALGVAMPMAQAARAAARGRRTAATPEPPPIREEPIPGSAAGRNVGDAPRDFRGSGAINDTNVTARRAPTSNDVAGNVENNVIVINGSTTRTANSFDTPTLQGFSDLVRVERRSDYAEDITNDTIYDINMRFDDIPEAQRARVTEFLDGIEDVDKKNRYMAMILNSSATPSDTFRRMRLIEAGENPRIFLSEIDGQVDDINRRLQGNPNLTDIERRNLIEQRNQLEQERFFIANGDNIQVTSITSANANNDALADSGELGRNLDNSFNIEIKVTGDDPLRLCGGPAALASGRMSLCSEELVDPDSPYTRLTELRLRQGDEITLGLGDNRGINDEGLVFMRSSDADSVPAGELFTSVQRPHCTRGNPACDRLVSTQSNISDVTVEDFDLRLATARSEVDGVISSSFDNNQLDNFLTRNSNPTRAIDDYLEANPELESAFNISREIDSKGNLTLEAGVLRDRDTITFNQIVEKANNFIQGKVKKEFKKEGKEAAEKLMSDFFGQNELARESEAINERIDQLSAEVLASDDEDERREKVQQIVNLRGTRADLQVGIDIVQSAFDSLAPEYSNRFQELANGVSSDSENDSNN